MVTDKNVIRLCDSEYYFVYTATVFSQFLAIPFAGNDVLSYNRKEMDIDVKENVAYQVPPSRIKMTENEAYAVLPNRSL